LEAGLIELETDKILMRHSDNVYLGIRKNLMQKINDTKISIELKLNELHKLGESESWIEKVEELSVLLKGKSEVAEIDKEYY